MELEEAINECNRFIYAFKQGDVNGIYGFNIQAIETVLQALENSQEECRQYREFIAVTGGEDVDDITATKYMTIKREGYLQGRVEEHEKAMQFIKENSIPKKKIEDMIQELKGTIEIAIRNVPNNTHYINELQYAIDSLRELLKEEIIDGNM